MLLSCALSVPAQVPATNAAPVLQPAAAPGAAPAPEGPTIALILPSQTGDFAQAAEAVRSGFFAAHKVDGQNASLQVIEIEDNADIGAVLRAARERGVAMAVGPLRRPMVSALVDSGAPPLPVVTLNYPERDGGGIAENVLMMSLVAEVEAQRVVKIALAEYVGTQGAGGTKERFLIIAGSGALERRVAQAFAVALEEAGERSLTLEASVATLDRFATQAARGHYEAAFFAMDGRSAALVRPRLARDMQLFGTSLMYVGNPARSPQAAALALDLDNVHFVDMPWLLEPEHPAVMIYPPAPAATPELARLYALGIDAYRVARLWLAGQTRFELDGVTGRLRVDRTRGPRVERTPVLAAYRNGELLREELVR